MGTRIAAPVSTDEEAVLAEEGPVEVNDVQSQLNPTRVRSVVSPRSIQDIRVSLSVARARRCGVSLAGGRHAMGGQQFGRDTMLLDMRRFNRVESFDRANGLVDVQAGIDWPQLIEYLHREQRDADAPWSIREKQTGVDRVTIGGSLAANAHGRGLGSPPLIADVESFVLVDAAGGVHRCSRLENRELFSLAIGGYGLFGVIANVTLRLAPRTKVERVVRVIPVKDLLPSIEAAVQEGFKYGDCQYATRMQGDPAAHPGISACYRPVSPDTPIPKEQRELCAKDWIELYRLARTDKPRAFDTYAGYYLSTSGQVYWSDTHQLAGDFDSYRTAVDIRDGTEVLTEVFVPYAAFLPFISRMRREVIAHDMDVTYGTIRFIEKDTESFLPWARDASVCIACNLHVRHTRASLRKARADFRRILDHTLAHGGTFYLTYHRWATRAHVERAYPRFEEWLHLKQKYDPHERFQSDWYRHYRALLAERR